MTTHTRSAGTGWREVAAHAARLGLSIGAYTGLLVLLHAALNTNPPKPIPIHPQDYLDHHLATETVISLLCGLTWLAHRAAQRWATRVGAALLLAAATAPGLVMNAGGPDLPLAVCVLSLYGGVAVCAFVGAGRPTTTSAASGSPAMRDRRWDRIGLGVAAFAVFILGLWSSLDTRLDQHWVWLTWSVCIWSSGVISPGSPTRDHPSRLRAAAVVGALLVPTAFAHVQLGAIPAAGLAGEVVARLVALVVLVLTLVVVGGCWWLSQAKYTECLSGLDADAGRADRRQLHAAGGHRPHGGAR